MLHSYVELQPESLVLYQGKLHYGRVVTYYYCRIRLRRTKPDSGNRMSLSDIELRNLGLFVVDTHGLFLSN